MTKRRDGLRLPGDDGRAFAPDTKPEDRVSYEEWKRKLALDRMRRRRKIKALLRKYKADRKSVRAVSGGLPCLGKRR